MSKYPHGPDENGQYDTDDCPCQVAFEVNWRMRGDGWLLERGNDGGYLITPDGWLDERQVLTLANTLLSEIEMGQRDPWQEDPEYPVWDWRQEVAQDATRRSYQHWVEAQREQAEHDQIVRGEWK